MKRGLGWLKDKPDPRDKDLTSHKFKTAPPPPPSASNRNLVVEVLDQGQLGACVANAVANAVRMAHVGHGAQRPPLLSRLGLYYLARAQSGDTANDTGTYTRAACGSLVKFGFAPESSWTYDDNSSLGPNGETPKFARMPSSEFFREGFDQVVGAGPPAYYRINETGPGRVTAVMHAVAAGHAVPFGTLVSEAFCDGRQDMTFPLLPPTGQKIAGGHELLVVGYETVGTKVEFEILNSWSAAWGNGGFFKMDSSYLTWSETDDLWVIDAPPLYSSEQS